MSEYPRTLPSTIPADKNARHVAVLSGWDADNERVVPLGVTMTAAGYAIATTASVTIDNITIDEMEISNDVGHPLPVSGVTGDFPDAAAATKLDEIKTRLGDILDGITGIHLEVGTVNVNTDELEAKLDTLLAQPSVAGSTQAFFQDETTPLGVTFAYHPFGFNSISISLTHDGEISEGYIEYSFDGAAVHGRLRSGEGFAQDYRKQPGIWLRGEAGGEHYRLGAY